MYAPTILITALAALTPCTVAAPLEPRSNLLPFNLLTPPSTSTKPVSAPIDNATFANLQLFSQYAAAAYCPINAQNANISTPITCPNSNNCPLLAQNPPVVSVWEFQHSFWTDVTGYIAVDPVRHLTVLSFRGSHTFRNWLANLDAGITQTDICPSCGAWNGFWLSWQEARDGIKTAFMGISSKYPGYKTVVVGHSLGGAIADLAAADLRASGLQVDLYTYGAPRVGGQAISDYITGSAGGKVNGSTFRVTHYDDPVPKLPPRAWGLADIGPEYWIQTGNGIDVGVGDVSLVQGADMGNQGDYGDVGVFGLLNLDVQAHLWYFGAISSCDRKGGDLFASA